jgi:hypothetical protein
MVQQFQAFYGAIQTQQKINKEREFDKQFIRHNLISCLLVYEL